MERITKAHVESAFKALCRASERRIATAYNDVGAWRLDHNGTYGGYVIEEIGGETGWVRQPFGARRHSAREMYDLCWFGAEAIELADKARAYKVEQPA